MLKPLAGHGVEVSAMSAVSAVSAVSSGAHADDAVHVATPSGPPHRPRWALPALCVTQVVGWGVLYYAFPVMLPALTRETGWPATMEGAVRSGFLAADAIPG